MMEKNQIEKLSEARTMVEMAEKLPEGMINVPRLSAAGTYLLGEVDRLAELEKKVLVEIKKASDEITELNEDWEAASEADCDFEVFERIQREMGRAQAQLKVLAGLLK